MIMKSLTSNRGSVMIFAVAAVAILLLMVVAVVKWSGGAGQAVTAKVSGDRMDACAQAARRYLLSQLSLNGVNATEVTIPAEGATGPVTIPDAVNAADQTRIYTGHYTESPSGTPSAETTISLVSGGAMGASRQQVRDLTNALPGSSVLGGQYFRVVVKCRQSDNRESEYEFVFRYGM
jgi:hypothetical protein